jgi:UDP-N-acetyl-2-amino-2-deoxyglucuronate dehydrogenase
MAINFGIVGCGHIAGRHARHIIDHPGSKLVTAFDIKPEKTEAFCKEYGIEPSNSLEELLAREDIDVVNICTPNGRHHTDAIAVLESKKHALVEKPMAIKKEYCEAMMNTLLQTDRRLFVVKQNRYNPPIVALKNLMNDGKLGDIYSVLINCHWNRNERYYESSEWKGDKELDGGTLFTQFSHFVDIFYFLFGDIEDDVSGFVKNSNHGDLIDFEDTGSFVFRFKSGTIGTFNYTTSCYEQNMEGSITIFAENATIKIGGKYLNVLDYQKTNGFDINDLPVSSPANNYGFYEGSMSNHDKTIHNIIETLNGNEMIKTNAMEGMKVVEIIEKLYGAAKWIQ